MIKAFLQSWARFFILATICLLSGSYGCSGGSVGTGGRLFDGVVLKDARPFPDVRITLLSTGDQTTTDSGGNFSLESADRSSSALLQLSMENQISNVTIVNIPDSAAMVHLRCHYNSRVSTLEVVTIEFIADDGTTTTGAAAVDP